MGASAFLPSAFSGKFLQEKRNIKGSYVNKSNLIIKYQYPSNFYLRQLGEDGSTYVCNRSKVWIYNPPFIEGEPGELSEGPSSKYCYSKIFDSLKYGLKSNRIYKAKKINSQSYRLVFSASAKEKLEIKSIVLKFKSKKLRFKNLDNLVIHYVGDNNPLTLTPQSLKTLKKLSKETFIFKAPKNTKRTKI